jgi:hypothetical protein
VTAEAELNQWRSLPPGHYKLYVVSSRVGRKRDEERPYQRVSEKLRSNTIDIEVAQADPAWQGEQLRSAVQTLSGEASQEESRHAARVLRFLNTEESTRELAKFFWGVNQQQPEGLDLMLGLYGSPYRQLAIQAMRAELTAPEHAITAEYLQDLVNLQMSADPAWDHPAAETLELLYWETRTKHQRELMKAEVETTLAGVSRKTGRTRAITLDGLLSASEGNSGVAESLKPALIASWADLPEETQYQLVQFRWPVIAGPEMAPILRKMLAAAPPLAHTQEWMARNVALGRLYELDPAAGRDAILRDLRSTNAQPDLAVVKLLPKEDLASAAVMAAERLQNGSAQELDFELVDGNADSSALAMVRAAFEKNSGKWACAPQSAMLRYFLRVDPEYGARQVAAALRQRSTTGCYRTLLGDLAEELPKVQHLAIAALDEADSLLAQDAAGALRIWGTKAAEAALWDRLQRLHEQWRAREDELIGPPDPTTEGGRAASIEQTLIAAIARGTNWLTTPDQLARLSELVAGKLQAQSIKQWSDLWQERSPTILTYWFPEDRPTFSILQYDGLTEDQLRIKLSQLAKGSEVVWQFWKIGEISPAVSMEKQDAVYERVRADAALHGVAVTTANR